jgi:RNA recognition motif-containing protein
VTFSTPDQQKKALEAFDGKELDGRTLTVKVAHKDDRRDAKGELRDEFKTAETREPRARGPRREGGDNNKGGAAAAPSEKKPSETIVYVSNLPFDFTDEDLSKVFAAHNPKSARIARRRNERSKGFGFVEFQSKKDQTAALALDNHKIQDREISVKVSLVGDNKEGGSKGGDRAERAERGERKPREPRENNNGGGNNNNAGRDGGNKGGERKERAPRQERKEATGSGSSSTIYVSNLPFDLTDDALAEVFRGKGHNPKSARIARRRDERSKGFGFVEFQNQEHQLAALKSVDQMSLGDRVISAKVALKDSETREGGNKEGGGRGGGNNNNANEGGDDAPKRKRNRKRTDNKGGDDERKEERKPAKDKKDSATLVYVSNLSFDVDDAALGKLFEGINIKSAHVAVRRNGKSKGFGFVETNTPADQKKALAKNGTELAGRTLVVEVAKEDAKE